MTWCLLDSSVFWLTTSVTSQHHPNLSLSLTSSLSMDAFTYLTDFFANTSDEDVALPTNEEGGSGTGPGYYCVIA